MTKEPDVTVNEMSLSTAMIVACCDDIQISASTGFLWEHNDEIYLVTNWHSLTGINPMTGKALSKTGARPNNIHVRLATDKLGQQLGYEVPLYDPDGRARWWVHPEAGEQVDIAIIVLPDEKKRPEQPLAMLAQPLNKLKWAKLERSVGDELFVIGYPRNLHMHLLPIWKRATFATEPTIFKDCPNRRQVWIDCASREGMSGSPVVQVQRAHYLRRDEEYEGLKSGYSFYGIYSGRNIDPDEDPRINDHLAAQIGIVWPKELIERILNAEHRDVFRRDAAFVITEEPQK